MNALPILSDALRSGQYLGTTEYLTSGNLSPNVAGKLALTRDKQMSSDVENSTGTPLHPGRGRRKGRPYLKGRQVDGAALDEVRALLGEAPRERELLVEFLHLLQDTYGHLSARHLVALASEMRIPMAEVHEVASFYARFDVVREGETPPPALTIRVCDSLSCQLKGAEQLRSGLAAELDPAQVRVVRAPCMGHCDAAPVAEVGRHCVGSANVDAVLQAVHEGTTDPIMPDYRSYDDYVAGGGYQLLSAVRAGERTLEDVLEMLRASGLRGLGGAGFPTAEKWRLVAAEQGPRYVVINADEGEPGSFKDRWYLESDPHRVLEGALIGAWSVEAEAVYVYLRDEYPAVRELLHREISRIEAVGLVTQDYVRLRRGAGAYVCGEESAMIESLEGKRGMPRQRPPYVAQSGLFGRPTLVNNVETVFWIRDVLEQGPGILTAAGAHGHSGMRSYSVSGHVERPGVIRAPVGCTAAELIDDHCGGMEAGHTLKAFLPGGASGGILPASMKDVPLDFGALEELGCFIGAAAVVVLSDKDDMRDVSLNLMRFFEDESCGQCTPCRVGCEKAVRLVQSKTWDENLLKELADVMTNASICGLGQAAANPFMSVLRYFREDVVESGND